MSELSEQLFKDMFFFCDQYVEQNTGNFKQKRSELIFKKLSKEIKGKNVAELPVDYAPASFQTIVNRTLTPGVLDSITKLTNFTEFPYDNSETVIVDVYDLGEEDEQGYLANLNTQTNGFITKSNLYIIKPLVNQEEILKHLGDLKNKHPNLEVMVYFIGQNVLSDSDKTFLSAFLDMFPEKSFVVVATGDGSSLDEEINEINDRMTPSNLNRKLLKSLTIEVARNNAVYNVPSKKKGYEKVIQKITTKLDSLALIQTQLLNIYAVNKGNEIRLKSDSANLVAGFTVNNENKDKLINIISQDLFGDNGRGPLYFFDERGQKYDMDMCKSDEQGAESDVKQFICSCATINQEIDDYRKKIQDLKNGITGEDKTFEEDARRKADRLAKELAANRPERGPADEPEGEPAANRPDEESVEDSDDVDSSEDFSEDSDEDSDEDEPERKPKGRLKREPAAGQPKWRPSAGQPKRRPAEDVGKKLTFDGVEPGDLKDKAPEIIYISKGNANKKNKIIIQFKFKKDDQIAAIGYVLYKNGDTGNLLDEQIGIPKNIDYYTDERLTIELTEDIKTTDNIHLQLYSKRGTFDKPKKYIFTYSLQ